ncbi:MAG: terminase family protein [Proteobacteria bacterium]|nr:terminase family protein [Pseudomonadota bacterium]
MKKNDLLEQVASNILKEKDARARRAATFDWPARARANQLPPLGDWRVWLILAGRGFGKTRTGAETIRAWISSKTARRIALVGHHHMDAKRVMVEGESGLLSTYPDHERPTFVSTQGILKWKNGARAQLFSALRPDDLRGPQFDAAWVDELAKFPDPESLWDQLMFTLRKGEAPRVIVTTTPRPCPFLKKLMAREGQDVVITRGTTFDNAPNLATSFVEAIEARYGHTRLGAQELYGEMVEDIKDALWTPKMLDGARQEATPPLVRLVIAIDPAVTSHAKSDETGLIVAGKDAKGCAYILADHSGRMTPAQWSQKSVALYHQHQADSIIAEVNQGGDLVSHMIKSLDPLVPFRAVRATRSKLTRAEPIAALYAQGRVKHVGRDLKRLEAQLTSYTPGCSSPDRMDALVWALTELLLNAHGTPKHFWVP